MNTHADNIQQSKDQTVSHNLPKKRSGDNSAYQFVDNRREANFLRTIHDVTNNSPLLKSITQLKTKTNNHLANNKPSSIQRVVIQFTIDELVTAVLEDNQAAFSNKLRAMYPGMDELISCEVAFKLARKAFSEGRMADVREICVMAHETRLPTMWVGHRVPLAGGGEIASAHPTSTVETLEHHPQQMPIGSSGTHYRSTGHNTFNRGRATAVYKESGDLDQKRGRAISATMRFAAPPFANNIIQNPNIPEADKDLFNNERDNIKTFHPDYDPTAKQARNAPWDMTRRGVSPARSLPDN
ncbi:hypothetical protein [Sphingobacterium paucimobilis]|nr:hypothetical protein [Sphingobacterium paucimobilis]